ncbi:MAG: PilZ domain-containing protein [Nitrospinaceae bacterium]|jgi:hypothetical protein|nr:PilZ domain-containing protein [Nitrospinaceae bacterium]MBT3433445.1 PilZ domain-containing protein [Nitrospinaceae bacterium]MBT3820163.1 PilZ domain-containing protein [Nitrospinaceae bacterium]MBT4094338.1 PilZ domain-containing protein [Nitrospinaceae bacterium]MBT4430940.1 PilZ domain-containing protein [Nitrospinaceae bacterium]
MPTTIEERVHERKSIDANTAIFDAPALSGKIISYKDISFGGLMIESSIPLEVCTTIPCSIQINGNTFMDCEATVAWISENKTTPPVWKIGFLLRVPENRRNEYEDTIEEAFPSYETPPSRA